MGRRGCSRLGKPAGSAIQLAVSSRGRWVLGRTGPDETRRPAPGAGLQTAHGLARCVVGDLRARDLILLRAEQRRRGQPGARTALVVQGGALRAIISCAAADALDLLGLRDAFDVVYGGSSGAINAACFLAGQAALGVTVYSEDLNNARFFNPWRLHRALDLKFLIDGVVRGRKALDRQALARQSSDLRIALTDFHTGELVWFDDFREGEALFEALEATCAIPAAYPQPVLVAGRPFTDGMINEPVPVLTALQEDYSAILVLLTRQAHYRSRARKSLPRRILMRTLMRRHASAPVYARLQTQWERYNEAMESLAAHPGADRPLVLGVASRPELVPARFEKRRAQLLASAYSGWRNTLQLFEYGGDMSRAAFDERLAEAKRTHARA